MEKERRLELVRIAAAGILFIAGFVSNGMPTGQLVLFMSSYLLVGWDVLWKAVKNILRGKVFDEHFLMSIATIGAICLRDFPEAAAVMLFYQFGEFFQDYAVDRSRDSIVRLMDLRAEYATIKRREAYVQAAPDEVDIGEIIVVRPGERVPLDGKVLSGDSFLDTSALTGESLPRHIQAGEQILSGSINQQSVLEIEVEKTLAASTATRILELVEHTSSQKAKSEHFITKFAKVYTPIVVLSAVVLALLPPLVTGRDFALWIERALTFLVISCPCALVVSIPLGFFAGIGAASRHGILVKGGNYLEALSKVETAVFDKTGTLTQGTFTVRQIYAETGYTVDEVLKAAAYAEGHSNHPIAQSILQHYGNALDLSVIAQAEEIPGHGTKVLFEEHEVLAGNDKLMEKEQISFTPFASSNTIVYIARDRKYIGCIEIGDEIKRDSIQAIKQLKKMGVMHTVMLTGDNEKAGEAAGKKIGVDEVYAKLLPEDKVRRVETLLEKKPVGKTLIFAGDGMNDAPVLARADVGIAMGALGSDAAIEAADVVLMTDEPAKIPVAIFLAKKTVKIVKENIIFAIGIKGIILLLGALGYASMWAAVFADVGVALLAILNALRILKQYGKKNLKIL